MADDCGTAIGDLLDLIDPTNLATTMQSIGTGHSSSSKKFDTENINDIYAQAMNPILTPLRTLAACYKPLTGFDATVVSLSIEAEVR